MDKTSTGLAENVAGLLCYALGWVSGLIFIMIEQENRFVRFHAMQSIIVFGVLTAANIILGWIPGIGYAITGILWLIGVALWFVLMIKAYQGNRFKLPWSGDLAEKWTA